MYHSVQKVIGLSFLKLSFKEASVYKLPQSSDMFTKSSDMLNKNTLGVKKCGTIRSSPTYMQPKGLISAEAKKSPIKDVSNYLNDIQ